MGNARAIAGTLLLALAAGGPSARAANDTMPAAMQECGACHMVYPPQFLPQRSWTALLGKLDQHFGEIATVTDAKKAEIAAYLAANAADAPGTQGGAWFLYGIASDATPLRITETPWWTGRHQEVNFAGIRKTPIRTASNCLGCHGGGGGGQESGERNETE